MSFITQYQTYQTLFCVFTPVNTQYFVTVFCVLLLKAMAKTSAEETLWSPVLEMGQMGKEIGKAGHPVRKWSMHDSKPLLFDSRTYAFDHYYGWVGGHPRLCSGKESACQCRRPGFDPWVRKIPWRRKWQSTPVFLPGESHGQRSPASMDSQRVNMTEQLSMHPHKADLCPPPRHLYVEILTSGTFECNGFWK